MKISWEPEAIQELDEADSTVKKEIKQNIEKLEEKPLPHNSYVIHLPDGTEIQCLKLQEEDRNSELNHRITYDIDGKEVRIYGVFPRNPGYQNIKQETQDRL